MTTNCFIFDSDCTDTTIEALHLLITAYLATNPGASFCLTLESGYIDE